MRRATSARAATSGTPFPPGINFSSFLLGATVVGINAQLASCANTTVPETVAADLNGGLTRESWICRDIGLTYTAGDGIRLFVGGRVEEWTTSFNGRAEALADGRILCRNLTQEVDVTTAVSNSGGWSCTGAGLPIAVGDSVQAIVAGTAE